MNIQELLESVELANSLQVNDEFDLELSEDTVIETEILDILTDGVVIELDQQAIAMLEEHGLELDINDSLTEAEYQGRKVPLGKRMPGDVKKSKVYVRKPNGKVVKVNFGDKKMKIKKSNPKRRKSFRARHRCANPGPRWKARYWSCRAW